MKTQPLAVSHQDLHRGGQFQTCFLYFKSASQVNFILHLYSHTGMELKWTGLGLTTTAADGPVNTGL